MVGRDIIVDVIRLIMVERGTVIAASKLGKLKTVSQMVGVVVALGCYTLIGDFGITQITGICDIIICCKKFAR